MLTLKQFEKEVRLFARDEQWSKLTELLHAQHEGDIAEVLNVLPHDDCIKVFSLIDEDRKPDVLAELEGRAGADVLEALSNVELAELVEDMAPDDAADVIADLSEARSEKVLDLMEDEESEEVRELLKYDEETAGGIMTPDVVSLRDNLTVEAAMEAIAYMEDDEPFYYAYVVNEKQKLIGYIGLWEIIKVRDRSLSLAEIAHKDIVSADVNMDQEEVARVIGRYDLAAIPVVDNAGKLLGRITVDDVVDVMEEEASEDLFMFAGSDDAELTYTSPLQACGARLPWLLITLCTGFITSFIFKKFITDLSQVMVLSFFVPIVMAMGGNTGIQSSTLIIRGIAVGSFQRRGIIKILGREVAAGAIMGVFCGLIIGFWARYLISVSSPGVVTYPPLFLAVTVGVSLFFAMTFAAVFGAFVPILLDRFRVDPAVASGPFVTSSNDIFALLIYYGVSILLLSMRSGAMG